MAFSPIVPKMMDRCDAVEGRQKHKNLHAVAAVLKSATGRHRVIRNCPPGNGDVKWWNNRWTGQRDRSNAAVRAGSEPPQGCEFKILNGNSVQPYCPKGQYAISNVHVNNYNF